MVVGGLRVGFDSTVVLGVAGVLRSMLTVEAKLMMVVIGWGGPPAPVAEVVLLKSKSLVKTTVGVLVGGRGGPPAVGVVVLLKSKSLVKSTVGVTVGG